MSCIELTLLAIGLSMDAFAVAICAGLAMTDFTLKKSLIIGLYFGVFQTVMPLVGFMAATLFADMIISYDHWIAFILLCILGGKMIAGSFKKQEFSDRKCGGDMHENEEVSLKPAQMLPLALTTSIDALAVGVSFAFLRISIIPAVSFIGITTLVLSMCGVKIGNVFGAGFKSKAELTGGVILVLIGVKILLEHVYV
jgi:putative Mn2+ efflux pump MntP